MSIRVIVLALLGRISSLLIQESVSFLGVDDDLERIEAQLKEHADDAEFGFAYRGRDIIYDLEDVIDCLITQSSTLEEGSSHPTNNNEIRYQLEKINRRIVSVYSVCREYAGSWWSTFDLYDLNMGNTVVSPVISKLQALATMEKSSSALRRKARWLRDEFRMLHAFVRELETKEISEKGMAWMEEVCDVSRFVEYSINLFASENEQRSMSSLEKFALTCLNLEFQQKLVKELDQILAKVQDILKKKRYVVCPTPPSRPARLGLPPSICLAEKLDVTSFNDDVDEIMAMLLKDDQNCLSISIVGMTGIGKTCLCKLIYDNDAIVNRFPFRAWVSLHHQYCHRAVDYFVEEITGIEVSWDPRECDWPTHLCKLREILDAFLMGRRSLFIFDCITTKYVWDALWRLLGSTSNGMRIIFTAPLACVNHVVDERSFIYKLHLRSNDESWALFTHTLKASIPAELLKLKRKILRTCGGLPRVIVKLAAVLSQKDTTMEEWSTVVEQLNQDKEPWSEPLYKINKDMPLYLRRCLFYFGLFPKDFEIPARRLIVLWVAEGLGRKDGINEPPEQVSESCLEELVSHGLVQVTKRKQNGKIRRCRLPDALREHWLSKAEEANFLQGPRPIIRRIADHLDNRDGTFHVIHGDNKPPPPSTYSCYRQVISFLSFDTRDGSKPGQEIGDFLDLYISRKCFYGLQVLDLEHVFRPKLPEAIAKLTRLKYLGLRWTCLKKLPSFICKLLNLQTLDLKRTSIDTLPNSIWTMEQLRHLYLDERNSCRFVRGPKCRYFMNLWTLWGLFVDEESPIKDGLDTIIKIRKLGLACRLMSSREEEMLCQLAAAANWVQKLEHLQCLRLKSYDQSNQPWELPLKSLSNHSCLTSIDLVGRLKNQSIVSEFPHKVTEITLSASGLTEDPMQMLDKLPNLKFLRLLSKSFTGETMLCSSKGFPQLLVLKVWELESLDEWKVQEGAMPRLKDLEIRCCKNMTMLPNGLQHITNLRMFKLSKMPKELINKIKDDRGIEHAKISHVCNVYMED